MPVLVGDGTTGTEGKSDRIGVAIASSDPASGVAGDLYFNTSSSKLKVYDGTGWNEIGTGSTNTVDIVDPFNDGSGLALWAMNGNSDDASTNYSGNSNNISWSSTAKFGVNSGDFNGSSTTISLPSAPKNSYPFSVSLWAQSDLASPWSAASGTMSQLMNCSINGQRVSLGFVNNPGWINGMTIMYGGKSHWSGYYDFMAAGGSTKWHHIVWSIAGNNDSSHRVWINGHPVNLYDNAGGHGGSAGWNIGSNSASGEWWDGRIDQVRFFNRELNNSEAWKLYTEGQTPTVAVTSHCKLHYDFSETNCYSGSGTTVNNIATGVPANTFTGTVDGATFGGSGNSKYFDFVTNDKIKTSDSISATMTNRGLTMEAWYYVDDVGTGGGSGIGGIVSSQNDGGGQNGASINTDSRSAHGGGPNGLHYQMGRTDNNWTTQAASGNTTQGTGDDSTHWHHVAATFDGKEKLCYMNGILLDDMGDFELAPGVGIDYGGCVWALGCQPDQSGDTRFFDGKIAIARVYDAALSHAQVSHNYNVERSRFAEPVDIYWNRGTAGFTRSNDSRTGTYSGSGYNDIFTGALSNDLIYDFKMEVTNGDNWGGWWFSDSNTQGGSHPDERGGNTLGLRGGEDQVGAHGTFASINGWTAGQNANAGWGSLDPSGNVNLDFVINMQVRKVWVKESSQSQSSWKGGGNPAQVASTPSFRLPNRADAEFIYFAFNCLVSGTVLTFSSHGQNNLS